MIKRKINLPIKLAILGMVVFIALFLIMAYLAIALRDLDCFKIKDISANKPKEGFDFSYLSGRNIFDIDLKRESRYIQELYPIYKNIRLFKILPNRLYIDITDRKPLAYVRLNRSFCVDSDRVLFNLPFGREAQDLPVIIGLERKILGPKPGRQYNIKELIIALNILQETDTIKLLKKYKIARIDVTNLATISCFIPLSVYAKEKAAKDYGFLEIRLGQDDIRTKIRVLEGLFFQLEDDINKIKYIDLRFKDPVVKFKDAT